jgi:hypothetical protein
MLDGPGGDQRLTGQPRLSDEALTSRVTATLARGALIARLRDPGDLTAAEVAALTRLDDGPAAPGEDWNDGSWADLEVPAPDLVHDGYRVAAVGMALDPGFTRQYGGGGCGFAGGGPLDVMLPGSDLAWYAGQARQRGLAGLSDDELCGVMAGARKLGSWAAELELAAVTELSARRAGPDGSPGEHVTEEIAVVLTLTRRSADGLLGLARNLSRLPMTKALLAAGIIDRPRAAVIAERLALLSDAHAAAVEQAVLPRAPGMTTGRLAAALDRAIAAYDPQAAIRRREKAQKDARVEIWAEPAGTAAIAGRDLAPASVITLDKALDADARWLAEHGMPGTHDQLRAAAFLARLAGQPLAFLLPQPSAGQAGTTDPAAPGTAPGAPATSRAAASGTNGLGGWVNLTMPVSAWLGLTDAPGEAGGYGPLDAGVCRELVNVLTANPRTRWCLTLTGPGGRAIAHGCATTGPPRASPGPAWLAGITIVPVATGSCDHRHESAGYRPAAALRHLIKVRSPRCGFPGCRRPALACDDDHTIPYHRGGRTCECNLHPLCRRHHQTKQSPGWHMAQPEPGQLTWTPPSGRRYIVTPEPYPW